MSENFAWPAGKRAALSLSFDDARRSQIDVGVPLLNKYEVRATFYLSFGNMAEREDAWRAAAQTGHEMGNHTTNHPCSGNFAWSRGKALEDYSLERMEQELLEANDRISDMLQVEARTFAFPCGQKFVGRGEELRSYVPLIAKHFLAGRGFRDEASNAPTFCDFAQLAGVDCDVAPFEELKVWIDQTIEQGNWLVFAGHDIGRDGKQAVTSATLAALCEYANDPANGIWIDTVENIAAYVKANRTEPA